MSQFQATAPDRENATYHHIAHFIDGHKEHGYSKRIGRQEPVNKIALLCGTVGRLVPRYLQAHPRGVCFKVEFYRINRVQTGANAIPKEELILTCEDIGWRANGNISSDLFCRSFLNALYASGLNFQKCEPMLKQYAKASPLTFDPATDSLECLKQRCADLLDQGYPRADVEQFFHAVNRKYFQDPQPAASPAVPAATAKRGGEPKSIANLLQTSKQ